MTELMVQDSMAFKFPGEQEFNQMKNLGAIAVKSGYLPTSIKTPEQAVTILFTARELGIPPMTAFWEIAVVQGRPCVSARLQRAMVFARFPNAVFEIVESTATICTIKAGRTKESVQRFDFTMTEAKLAGLADKDNWKKWPKDMLVARASGRAIRAIFPDIVMAAAYNREEMTDRDDTLEMALEEKPAILGAKSSLKSRMEKITKPEDVIESTVEELKPQTVPLDKPEIYPEFPKEEPVYTGARVERYPGLEENKLTKPPF